MKRRQFFQHGGFATGAIATLGLHTLLARAAQPANVPKRLIVIFLRGAVDGLSVVVPYQESIYYASRPRIALPKPGQPEGAIDLDGRFGLHPALGMLMPLWQQGNLGFVHASGSPDPTRSHFEAQTLMESGTTSSYYTSDGWMNRLLAAIANHNPIQAVSVSPIIPRILSGKMPVANFASNYNTVLDRPQFASAFNQLYRGSDPLSQSYQEGQAARQAILSAQQSEMQMANNGAPPSSNFGKDAQRLAQAMVRDPRIQLAFMALDGWDTHVNQGSSKGALATNLGRLGNGLVVLQQGLGSVFRDTTIMVMSEFGRTVHENGNSGTDHGHGNVIWLLGGPIRGGKIYGNWPGLEPEQLDEGRDLAVTTDFRDVVSTVLLRHLNISDTNLAQVLPKYTPQQKVAVL